MIIRNVSKQLPLRNSTGNITVITFGRRAPIIIRSYITGELCYAWVTTKQAKAQKVANHACMRLAGLVMQYNVTWSKA